MTDTGPTSGNEIREVAEAGPLKEPIAEVADGAKHSTFPNKTVRDFLNASSDGELIYGSVKTAAFWREQEVQYTADLAHPVGSDGVLVKDPDGTTHVYDKGSVSDNADNAHRQFKEYTKEGAENITKVAEEANGTLNGQLAQLSGMSLEQVNTLVNQYKQGAQDMKNSKLNHAFLDNGTFGLYGNKALLDKGYAEEDAASDKLEEAVAKGLSASIEQGVSVSMADVKPQAVGGPATSPAKGR